jgi:hypothetical protein
MTTDQSNDPKVPSETAESIRAATVRRLFDELDERIDSLRSILDADRRAPWPTELGTSPLASEPFPNGDDDFKPGLDPAPTREVRATLVTLPEAGATK